MQERIAYLMGLLSDQTLAVKIVMPCRFARDLVRGRPLLHQSFPVYRADAVSGMQVIMGAVLGGVDIPEQIAEEKLIELLSREHSSIEDFYPEASTGLQGGMSRFWDVIIESYTKSLSHAWYSHVIENEIDLFDYDLITSLLEAFIARYHHIIDPSLKQKPVAAIMADWRGFLIQSARLLSQFQLQLTTP